MYRHELLCNVFYGLFCFYSLVFWPNVWLFSFDRQLKRLKRRPRYFIFWHRCAASNFDLPRFQNSSQSNRISGSEIALFPHTHSTMVGDYERRDHTWPHLFLGACPRCSLLFQVEICPWLGVFTFCTWIVWGLEVVAFAIFMFRLTRKLEHQSRLLFVKVSLGREEALSKHNNSCIVCQYMQRPTFLAYSQYDEGKAFCIWPVRKDTVKYVV